MVENKPVDSGLGARDERPVSGADRWYADRPVWYKLAMFTEPTRPLFGWAVAHKQGVKAGAVLGLLSGLILAVRRKIS